MEKRTELKAVSYISADGEAPVRFDSLTPEKKAEYAAKMAESIGRALSVYCSEHPDEAEALLNRQEQSLRGCSDGD